MINMDLDEKDLFKMQLLATLNELPKNLRNKDIVIAHAYEILKKHEAEEEYEICATQKKYIDWVERFFDEEL